MPAASNFVSTLVEIRTKPFCELPEDVRKILRERGKLLGWSAELEGRSGEIPGTVALLVKSTTREISGKSPGCLGSSGKPLMFCKPLHSLGQADQDGVGPQKFDKLLRKS